MLSAILYKQLISKVDKTEVEKHFKLLILLARKFCVGINRLDLLDDMIQSGCLGLIEACKRFDSNKGTKFSTYALYWIKCYMLDEYSKIQPIKLSQFLKNKGHQRKEVLSFDSLSSSGTINALEDYCTDETINTYKQVLLKIIKECLMKKILSLQASEVKLLNMRYYQDMTFSEIGTILNCSKQCASEIERRAIRKLKEDKEIQNLYPLYTELLQ